MAELSDQSRSGGRLVLPVGLQCLALLVVSGKAVNTTLNQNQAKLGVLVLAVLLQVLADVDGLLDEVVQILRELRSQACTTLPASSKTAHR